MLASLLIAVLAMGLAGSASAGPFILASRHAGIVSVIDAESNTVVTAVPIGGDLIGISVSPDGASAYVGVNYSGTVSVIETASGAVAATIPVGTAPGAFAFTRDGAHAYVADQSANAVWVVDTEAGRVVGEAIPVGSPHSIAIAPDDSLVYVVDVTHSDNTLSIIDSSARAVIDTVPLGHRCSSGIALSPDGAFAYVAAACGIGGGSVSVVSTSSRLLIAEIQTRGFGAHAVAVTGDGRLAYVSNSSSRSVSIIDLSTYELVGSPIPVGGSFAGNLVVTPDDRFVYVDTGTSVSVIETATNTVVATIPVPGGSGAELAIAPRFTVVPAPECVDGVDNDGDGLIDHPSDPGCSWPGGSNESPVCNDGIDNDGDGLTDFSADPGCGRSTDESEKDAALVCDDGIDNDGDGLADFPADPGCDSASDGSEKGAAHACDDGFDNDVDGSTDYPADRECRSLTDLLEEPEVDSDDVADAGDNCISVANPSQLDSNLDGYGNACDADYDDDGIVGTRDLVRFRRAIRAMKGGSGWDPLFDADGDGALGSGDWMSLLGSLGAPPGPSGLACAGTVPCPSIYPCDFGYCY